MNKRPTLIELILFLLLAFLWSCIGFGAERHANWKLFRLPDSASSTVSFSPRGKVLLKSGETGAIHWLDGYQSGEHSGLEANSFRVYESRSGQLWSLYPEGLKLYDRSRWLSFPIAEIRNELRANPLWQIKQISLVPAELNRVFFLLPDRLYEFETGKQLTLIKHVNETSLRRFLEMHESASGDIWVSGINSLARIPGPTRRLSRETQWQEFAVEGNQAYALQRPFEKEGNVTTAALPVDQNGSRLVLQLKEDEWSTVQMGNEKIRSAWQGWDNQIWALTFTSLLRINLDRNEIPIQEAISSIGTQYDVAVEPGGAFWLATSEGLVRYASPLWRALDGFERFDGPLHGFVADNSRPGLNWFIATEGLVRSEEGRTKHFPWPDDFNPAMQGIDAIYQLQDGRFVVSAGYQPMAFDPSGEMFQFLQAGTNRFRVLGQTPKGELITKIFSPDPRLNSIALFNGTTNAPLMMLPEEWAGADIFFAYMAASGDLWIGSNLGLACHKELSNKVEFFNLSEGSLPERIFSLAEGPRGRLWAGGVDHIFELQGKSWVPVLSGVDRVNAITRDLEGNYWIASASGLYRFVDGTWIHHDAEAGLPSQIVYEIKTDQLGQLIACTSRGAMVLHPEADPDPPKTLEPLVRYPATPSTVEPTTISFAGIDKWDYTPSHQLLFAAKLDEAPWSPFTNTATLVFEKLSSGKHRLEVRAMDRNGNRDPETSILEFVVIVPWFQDPRLLAVSLLGVVMVFVLGGVAVNRHLQLKRSYAAVEKIVAERTRALEKANQELLMTEKMRAIGTMSAGIAHDFNNILSIIKGSAQIIEANVEDKEKIKTRVGRIKMVVEQGSNIVKAMLGIGRLDEKNLEPCDIAEMLEDSVRLLSDRFPEGIRFKVTIEGEDQKVNCSREALNQMLLNLLLNAAEAVGAEGEIVVSARNLDQLPPGLFLEPTGEGPWLEISVADNGNGISAENLPRIFEPFFTTKALSSRRGTGLGLSMVYELAKGMHYGLKVESALQQGSRFSIYLSCKPVILQNTSLAAASAR